jgi:hypothetical protein
MKAPVTFMLMSILIAAPTSADKVVLLNGQSHEGEIVEETDRGTDIRTDPRGAEDNRSGAGDALVEHRYEGEYERGLRDGKKDAESDPGYIWFLTGLGCGCIGVGAAYLMESSAPSEKLVGESAEYALGYTEAYEKNANNLRVGRAGIGCLITSVALFIWLTQEAEEWEFPFESGIGCASSW